MVVILAAFASIIAVEFDVLRFVFRAHVVATGKDIDKQCDLNTFNDNVAISELLWLFEWKARSQLENDANAKLYGCTDCEGWRSLLLKCNNESGMYYYWLYDGNDSNGINVRKTFPSEWNRDKEEFSSLDTGIAWLKESSRFKQR